jgi:hypothetical protein
MRKAFVVLIVSTILLTLFTAPKVGIAYQDSYNSYSISPILQSTLNTGYIHGLIYVNGYLYGSSRTNPAHILKINPSTLQIVKDVIPAHGSLQAIYCDDIVYVNGYIWTIDKDGYLYKFSTELDQLEFWRIGYAYLQKVVYDQKYLYISGSSGFLCKFDLLNITFNITYISGSNNLHTMIIYEDYLYVVDVTYNRIFKLSKSNLTIVASSYLPYTLTTDDSCTDGTYIYLATETNPSHIMRVTMSNLSVSCYEVNNMDASYGIFIVQNTLVNLDMNNNNIWTFFLQNVTCKSKIMLKLQGEGGINELANDNTYIYLTQWTNPATIIKLEMNQILTGFSKLKNPDVNNDGIVNLKDAVEVILAVSNAYYSKYDIDSNGVIDMHDVMIIIIHFGDKLK